MWSLMEGYGTFYIFLQIKTEIFIKLPKFLKVSPTL